MKLISILSTLFIVTLMTSCLVPPATSYRVIVPAEILMKYRKFIPSDEKITFTSYQKVVTELPDGSTRTRIFYPEKYQCTSESTYNPNQLSQLHGTYKEWWDNGHPSTVGNYAQGKKDGIWSRYSMSDGTLTSEVNFKEGEKDGLEKNYLNSKLSSSYNYDMGVIEGDFMIYDTLGQITNQGVYKSDTIFSQTLVVDNKAEVFKVVEEMPLFDSCIEEKDYEARKKCATKKMLVYIYSNIKYPADAREKNIEGTAIIRFVIDKDGSIIDVNPIRGVSQTIENECLRIVNSMQKWVPGMQGGEPVKVQYNLPIKFKLQ